MSYVFDSLCTMTMLLLLTSLKPFRNLMTYQFPGTVSFKSDNTLDTARSQGNQGVTSVTFSLVTTA